MGHLSENYFEINQLFTNEELFCVGGLLKYTYSFCVTRLLLPMLFHRVLIKFTSLSIKELLVKLAAEKCCLKTLGKE